MNNSFEMNRKVLFFINSEVGGAERIGVLISKMLINAGYYVEYVIINDDQNKTSITDFINPDSKISTVSSKSHFDKLKQFHNIIKDANPSCVFSTNYSVNDKLLLLKPLFNGVKFVLRSDFYFNSFGWKEKMIIRLAYRFADALIVQNEEMKQEFLQHNIISPQKIAALDNPVDKDSITKKLVGAQSPYKDDGRKHIVAVGRTSYQKGYDILVRALSEIVKDGESVDLYIVGSNIGMWEEEYLRICSLVNQYDICDNVHFIGYQSNPYPYIKFADCFVLSSRWEGLPNVLAEALFLKVPVAAFKCIPIIERMVRDGIDGYLAEKEDALSLVASIKKALKLGRTNPIYQGASEQDFVQLFNGLVKK